MPTHCVPWDHWLPFRSLICGKTLGSRVRRFLAESRLSYLLTPGLGGRSHTFPNLRSLIWEVESQGLNRVKERGGKERDRDLEASSPHPQQLRWRDF